MLSSAASESDKERFVIRWLTLYTPKQCLVTSRLLCSFLIAGRLSAPELNYTASYREMKDHFVRR